MFLSGVIVTILVILFLIWGVFSVLGNEMNPASFVVGFAMRYPSAAIIITVAVIILICYLT